MNVKREKENEKKRYEIEQVEQKENGINKTQIELSAFSSICCDLPLFVRLLRETTNCMALLFIFRGTEQHTKEFYE